MGAANADLMTLMLGRDFHQVLPTNILPQFHNSIARNFPNLQNLRGIFSKNVGPKCYEISNIVQTSKGHIKIYNCYFTASRKSDKAALSD